jgi:hypothetical protein
VAALQGESSETGGCETFTQEEDRGEDQEPYHYLVNLSINKHVLMEAGVKQELMGYASTKLTRTAAGHWRYMRAGAVTSNFPAAKAEFEQRCALLCGE